MAKLKKVATKSKQNLTSAFSPLAEMATDAVCLCDSTLLIDINPAGLALLGYSGKGTPVGKPFASFVASDESKKLSKSLASLTRGNAAKRLDIVGINGRVWAANVRAKKLDKPKNKDRVIVTFSPVESEALIVGPQNPDDARYRDLIAASTDCVCVLRQGTIAFINEAGHRMFGGDDVRLTGQAFSQLVHPDYRDAIGDDLSNLVGASSTESGPVLIKIVNDSGESLDCEVRVWPFGSKGDGAVAVELRNVTRRIRAAAAVRQSEERLGSIVDAVTDAVVSIDERGQIKSFNAAAETLFGKLRGDAIGMMFAKFVPDWTGYIATGTTLKPVLGPTTVEVPSEVLGRAREVAALRKDRTEFPAEITVTSLQQGADSLFTAVVRDITARKAAEDAQKIYAAKLEEDVSARTAELRSLSRQTRQILEAANEGIIGIDLEGRITMANPTAAEILDRDLSALKGMSVDGAFILGTGSDHAGESLALKAELRDGLHYITHEARLMRGDGLSFDAEYAIAPIREKTKITGFVLTLRDVSERKQAESELRLAATVFEHTSEGLLVADSGERITKINRAFTAISGYSAAEVFGQPIRSILFSDDKVYRDTMEDLRKVGQVEWEQWCKNKTGDRYAARQALSLVRGPRGEVQQFAAIINDITERKLDEEHIRYQANYDQLTGIPNRALFMDRLSRLVIESRRTKTNIGLMFIDLDGFKAVNDTLGHDAGDLLLKQTADRLNFCVRESDTVARLGGMSSPSLCR
jgi:PAS domain S-box-containing protein